MRRDMERDLALYRRAARRQQAWLCVWYAGPAQLVAFFARLHEQA